MTYVVQEQSSITP